MKVCRKIQLILTDDLRIVITQNSTKVRQAFRVWTMIDGLEELVP